MSKKDLLKEPNQSTESTAEGSKKVLTAEPTKNEDLVKPEKSSQPDLSEVLKKIAELTKQNELLMSIADKKALSQYYQKNQQQNPSIIKIRTIDGKVIKSWKTIDNDVFKDLQTGRWVEKQTIELTFQDESTKQLNLVDFSRRFDYIECKKNGQIINDATGETSLKLQRLDNGEEIIIDVKYVN